jgi:hypothetical protein
MSVCLSVNLFIRHENDGIFLLLYCNMHHVSLYYTFFSHCPINGTTFGKILIENKMWVLIFCTTFVWDTSHFKKISAKCHKFTWFFMERTGYSCYSWMKLDNSRHIFKKFSNTKFQENPSNGSVFVPCGRTHRRTAIIKLIIPFTNETKIYTFCPHYAFLFSVCISEQTAKYV